ncbi:MAG: dependent oxidoreductase [Myxococcaceae bacterium]|nr:dependent oxidoreductase [Myxococcaceae bacterium]
MAEVTASKQQEQVDSEPTKPLPGQAAVTIIGGGIAGLASAWQLAELGVRDVVLVESEPALATQSSARNAAIFLPLEESLTAVWLASRARDLLDARIGTSWLSAQGVTLCTGRPDALDELKFTARRLGVYHTRWAREEIARELPALRDGECMEALHLPLGGVIDISLVLARLRRWALGAGVHIATAAKVEQLEVERTRVTGVLLSDGRRIQSERVVLAAGAWASALGKQAGSAIQLTPYRRHLVQLSGSHMPGRQSSVAWRVDEPVYYRPEAGGILASPCDETPHEAGLPESDPSATAVLHERLGRLAPQITQDSTVERAWACLRTMTADKELLVGPDGKVKGLYWCAGLGGRGMTVGAAAGELLARTMLGLAHPLARPLGPERFL